MIGIWYSGTRYLFSHNIQGDIISIHNDAGDVVARYTYDAYGNHQVLTSSGDLDTNQSSIGNINPFRYRGYHYDVETGLYYLNSRYYDPRIGRFISPDIMSILDETMMDANGLNLYMYCGNNPVMRVDPMGREWWDVLAWIGLGLVAVAAIVLTAGIGGAVIGGIIYGAAIGTAVLGATGAAIGAAGGMIYDAANGNDFGTSILTGVKIGFGIGAIAGAIIGGTIGGVAASSVTGLTNVSLWTGLGKNGASIAANAAGERGMITIGQTFGGKIVGWLTDKLGYTITKFLWASLSKTMVSTISMSVITLFNNGFIDDRSVFKKFEEPTLLELGIKIIKLIIGE